MNVQTTFHSPEPAITKKRDVTQAELHDLSPRKRLAEALKAAPSNLASLPKSRTIRGLNVYIRYTHPTKDNTIPVALMDKSLGIFQDQCKEPPSQLALAPATAISECACRSFSSESARTVALQDLSKRQLDLNLEFGDGHLEADIMPPMIRGCRNSQQHALNETTLFVWTISSRRIGALLRLPYTISMHSLAGYW